MTSTRIRRIVVIGLPIFQSVGNLGSVAIANYTERQGNWRVVFAAEASAEALRFLRKIECDGAIVRILSPAMRREAQKIQVPVINVSSWLEQTSIPTVRHDYRTCGRIAAEYLLGKGYRRFGCVVVPGECVPRRFEQFNQTLLSRGIRPEIFQLHSPKPFLRLPLSLDERKRFANWVRTLSPPAALVLMDDWDAPALMRTCESEGFRIPRDLAILSIGIHSETLASCPVPLTAVQEDHEGQMKRVVEDLELMMSSKSRSGGVVEIAPLGVVERASTASDAIEDRSVAKVVEYLKANLGKTVSISRLANTMAISRATLDRRFQDELGLSPHKFVISERIKLAQHLITNEPSMTLDAISRQSGFLDRRRLNLVFRQFAGVSPAKWRSIATK